MKPRWLGPSPISQVNYQCNNYTCDLRRNAELRHIHKIFHIGLLKPYWQNNQLQLTQRDYRELGPVKDDRYEVKKAVNLGSVTPEKNLSLRLDGRVIYRVWIHGSTEMR